MRRRGEFFDIGIYDVACRCRKYRCLLARNFAELTCGDVMSGSGSLHTNKDFTEHSSGNFA